MTIRRIEEKDNLEVESLIIKVMTEYNCVGEGYSINDAEVKDMYAHYNNSESAFFVIEVNDKIQGCGGIAPLKGSNDLICELRKMYFYPELRGLGMGQKLLGLCLEKAKELGYEKCYLETVNQMESAKKLYIKNGFSPLESHLGNTGHCSCDSYFIKPL